MSVQQFSAGRKVYGQGSYAPTRGPVSAAGAQGYLQREIRKRKKFPYPGVSKTGGDGMSDTRSGVAQAALNRRKGNGGIKPLPIQHPNPNQGIIIRGEGQKPDKPGPNIPGGPDDGRPITTPGTGNNGGGLPSIPPSIPINANGTLDLPFDANWSTQLMQGLQSMNQQLLQLQMGDQQQDLDFASMVREAALNYDNQKRTDLNSHASLGTAFSSAYGTSVADTARGYQNQMNDLNSADSLYNTQVSMQRAAIQAAFADMIRQEMITRGQDLMGQAGSGIAPPAPTPTPQVPTSISQGGIRGNVQQVIQNLDQVFGDNRPGWYDTWSGYQNTGGSQGGKKKGGKKKGGKK